MQNCDFTASSSMDTNSAILGSGTFIGNDISNSENGIVLQGGASVVRDNYIHDLKTISAIRTSTASAFKVVRITS